MPNLYVIAGCNGAGKTTTSYTLLPEILGCKEFVNADEIARGLSPFQPNTVSFQSGRIMIERIQDLLKTKSDFGFETTLASKGNASLIHQAKKLGYTVVLIFFWLESIDLAKARVSERVDKGGHNIPVDVIERRYERGLRNFISIFMDLSDSWILYNNSMELPAMVAKGNGFDIQIYNDELWKKIVSRQ